MAFRRPLVFALALVTLTLAAGCGEKDEGGAKPSRIPGWDLSSLPPAEPVRVIEGDDVAILIEEIPFAVFLEGASEHPTVTMIVGHLRVLQFRIDIGGSL